MQSGKEKHATKLVSNRNQIWCFAEVQSSMWCRLLLLFLRRRHNRRLWPMHACTCVCVCVSLPWNSENEKSALRQISEEHETLILSTDTCANTWNVVKCNWNHHPTETRSDRRKPTKDERWMCGDIVDTKDPNKIWPCADDDDDRWVMRLQCTSLYPALIRSRKSI